RRAGPYSFGADPLDFPFEGDVGLGPHAAPDFLAQRLDIGTGRATEIQQEIAMLFRDLCATQYHSAAAGGIDQRPRFVARGVLEGRTAGAAADRLRLVARGGDAVHLGANFRWVARVAS